MRRFAFSLAVVIASLGWLGSTPSPVQASWSWADGSTSPTYTAYYANFYANPYYYTGYYANWGGTYYRSPNAYPAPTYPAYSYSSGYYYAPTWHLGYYYAPYVYAGYYYPTYIPSYYYTPAIYATTYPYYGYYYPYWYTSAYSLPLTTSGYASTSTTSTTSNVVQASATTTSSSPTPLSTLNVEVMDNGFNPETMTVVVGTTIRWTNSGKEKHTITSDTDKWDSGEMAPGQAFSATFTQPGIYNYSCKLNKDLHGTIIVK